MFGIFSKSKKKESELFIKIEKKLFFKESILRKNINATDKNDGTALMLAASEGHKNIVEFLLEKGANINIADNGGYTAFILASRNGYENIVEFLLKKDIDINESNTIGNTALQLASSYGHEDLVELLLKNGADVNHIDDNGFTALMDASMFGFKSIVEALENKGANINCAEKDNGFTPLIFALTNGHKDTVKLLLEKGADVDITAANGMTVLMLAISKVDKDIVELLLEKGANIEAIDNAGATALIVAASEGHKDVTESLLEKGADIEAISNNGFTPLIFALTNGHKDTVKLLLEKGANFDINNKEYIKYITKVLFGVVVSDIFEAVLKGHKEIIEFLLEKGLNIEAKNKDGFTALSTAVWSRNKEIVKFLLEKGANIAAITKGGNSVVMVAASVGDKEIVEFVLQKGANINDSNKDSNTALMVAIRNGRKDMFEFLLEKGANINDYTALRAAIATGRKDMLEFLLEKGVNIEATDNNGDTALIFAAKIGQKERVEFLLQKGANIYIHRERDIEYITETLFGVKVSDIFEAVRKANKEIVKFLLQKGANIEAKDFFSGNTPLLEATNYGHEEIVAFLLQKGANIRAKDSKHNTLLHLAVLRKRYNIIETHIDHGIDINAKNNNHISAPTLAALKGNYRLMEIFLKHSSDLEFKKVLTPIILADHKNISLKLINYKVDILGMTLTYKTDFEGHFDWATQTDGVKNILGLRDIALIDEHNGQYIIKVYNDSKESQLLTKLFIDNKKPEFFNLMNKNHTCYFFFKEIPGITIDMWNRQKQLIEDILKIPVEIEKYDSTHSLYDSSFCDHELIIIKESAISSMPENLGLSGKFLKQAEGQWIFENVEEITYKKWNEKLNEICDYLGQKVVIASYDVSKGHLYLQESIDERLPKILQIEEDGNYPEIMHIETNENGKRYLYYSEVDGLDNFTKWKRKTKEIIKKLGSNVFIEEFDNRKKTVPVEADHMILIKEVDAIPEPKELAGLNVLTKQQKEKIYWGVGAEGDYYTDIADATHMLVMGENGSGKSNFMNGLILSLLNSLESIEHIYMVDFKGGVELHEYSDFAPQKITMVDSTQKLLNLLHRIKLEMEARLKYMRDNRLKKIQENPIFLIIDEYADIQQMDEHTSEERQIKNEILSLLKDLTRKARATNIKIWAMLQEASVENMEAGFKNQLKSRVLLKTTAESTAKFAIPDNYLNELQLDVTRLPTGRIVFVDASADRVKSTELQFPLVDADDIHPNDKKFYHLNLKEDMSQNFSKTIASYFEAVIKESPDLKYLIEEASDPTTESNEQHESIQEDIFANQDEVTIPFAITTFDINQLLGKPDNNDEENQKNVNDEANLMAKQFKLENNL